MLCARIPISSCCRASLITALYRRITVRPAPRTRTRKRTTDSTRLFSEDGIGGLAQQITEYVLIIYLCGARDTAVATAFIENTVPSLVVAWNSRSDIWATKASAQFGSSAETRAIRLTMTVGAIP